MNDQDKEAFEKWFIDFWDNDFNHKGHHKLGFEAWQATCDYKQREIDKLQAENSKLRECVEFYSDNNQWEGREIDGNDWRDFYEDGNGIGGKRAAETLKNLELK